MTSSPLDPLGQPQIRKILERAARGAGVPLSIHSLKKKREGALLAAWGECAACRHVNAIPVGQRACRQSRQLAANIAVAQTNPLAFTCHLGFACVEIAPKNLPNLILTFGPYCPAEHPRGLENDVLPRLSELLAEKFSELPFSLDDIRIAPKGSITTVAEWTVDELDRLLISTENLPTQESSPTDLREIVGKQTSRISVLKDTLQPVVIAAAAGDFAAVTRHLTVSLNELGPRTGVERRGAYLTGTLSALLNACQVAGADLSKTWPVFAGFAANVTQMGSTDEMISGSLQVFHSIQWTSTHRRSSVPKIKVNKDDTPKKAQLNYRELNILLLQHYVEGITLEQAAHEMGVSPTAITHRLQRRFGMSYSDYLGKLRVDKAKALLRRTKLGIAEVASRVGVSDPSNLGRLFRRHAGISPGQYRERFGKRA